MKEQNELVIELIKAIKYECDKNNNMDFLFPYLYRNIINELKFPNGENLYNLGYFDKELLILGYKCKIEFVYTYNGSTVCDINTYGFDNGHKYQETLCNDEIPNDYCEIIWMLVKILYKAITSNEINSSYNLYFDIIYS